MAQITQDHDRSDPQLENNDAPTVVQQTQSSLSALRQLIFGNDEDDLSSEPVSPIMSNRESLDSDRFSAISGLTYYFPSNPLSVHPPPAYVAPFGASQVVSEHQGSKKRLSDDDEEGDEDDDEKENKEDIAFSEPALALVNAFLDQLLYSFLSNARSTSLVALRPAISEILKHRLAKDAISNADEELSEMLAGAEDEEEMDAKHKAAENNRKWDLELVWKRTRLRVMVYMRLGEMEDEDEQRYVKEDNLFHGTERRFSKSSGLVSWAAAIFVTSVLEYVAEQTLQVAGQAAYNRTRRQSRSQRVTMSSDAQTADELMVEEHDVEKVALDAVLGRLWRSWRKALRNNTGTPNRRSSVSVGRRSRDRVVSAMSNRKNSFSTAHEEMNSRPVTRDDNEIPEMIYPEYVLAANIPLPIGNRSRDIDEILVPGLAKHSDDSDYEDEDVDKPYPKIRIASYVPLPLVDERRDVDEIEVPGLARDPDAEHLDDGDTHITTEQPRRKSMSESLPYRTTGGLPTPDVSTPSSPSNTDMLSVTRHRSMSVPTPIRTPLPADASSDGQHQFEASTESTNSSVVAAEFQGEDPKVTDGAVVANSSAKMSPRETPKAEFPWITAGAVAGTSAAAAAWVVTRDSTDLRGVSNADDSQRQDVGQTRSMGMAKSSPSLRVDVPQTQRKLSDKDIEELDKRKSLMDIKSMMIVNSPSTPGSGRDSPQNMDPQTLSQLESRTEQDADRPNSFGSTESYTLGRNKSQGSLGRRDEEVAEEAQVVQVAPGMRAEARDVTKKPARLVLSDTRVSNSQDSPTIKQTPSPATQRQYSDSTRQEQRTGLAALTNGVQRSPVTERSSPRQAGSTSPEQTRPRHGSNTSSHQKQSSDSQKREHPLVQRMASLKRNEPKSPAADKSNALTSASIRGPEDFEHFIQGGDTLKYTLTPEYVRENPIDDESSQYPWSRQSPVELDAQETRKGRSQRSKQATSAISAATAASVATDAESITSRKRRSISRPTARNQSASRKSGMMAREPRVQTESTTDFADFIRSTGPDKEQTLYPIMKNASTVSLHSLRKAHIDGASATASANASRNTSRATSPAPGERPKSLAKSIVDDENVPPVPPIPGDRKSTKMQARSATAIGDGSSDLIDFIRSGPDQSGEHRISRNVAPFRSTMDSDQMHGLGTNHRNSSAVSVRSAHSMNPANRQSAYSRSAMVNKSAPNSRPRSGATTPKSVAFRDDGGARKQYRNKDPYSMDFLDDTDDERPISRASRHRQESFIDFLNSQDPPRSGSPRPLVDPNSAAARNAINSARLSNMRAAADSRRGSVAGLASPRPGYASGYASSIHSTHSVDHDALEKAYIRNSTSTPPVPSIENLRARGERAKARASARTDTGDLAEYLKSSGPPEEANGAPAPVVSGGKGSKDEEKTDKKKKKKIGSLFSRVKRKKHIEVS